MIVESAIRREELTQTLGLEAARRSPWRRRLWWLGCLLLLAGGGAWGYTRLQSATGGIQYLTKPVERGDIVVSVVATGTLEPTNQVDVGSELSGIVSTVNVDYNDRVTNGQVLAVLDTSKFASQVAQYKAALQLAEAELASATATIKEEKFDLERVKRLSQSAMSNELEQVTTQAAYDRAVASELAAQAKVAQAKASLDTAETELSKTVIRSPVNGIVLERSIEPGQTVAASLQAPVLFTLAEDLTQMELQVDIDEADISQVADGQAATFTVDAYPNRTFDARITQVRYGPETTSGVVTYKAVLLVDNADLLLRPGMTATASITVKQVLDALLVSNAALRFTPAETNKSSSTNSFTSMLLPRPPGPPDRKKTEKEDSDKSKQKVWVLEQNQPVAINITVGESDGSHTAVESAELQPGQLLIVDATEAAQ